MSIKEPGLSYAWKSILQTGISTDALESYYETSFDYNFVAYSFFLPCSVLSNQSINPYSTLNCFYKIQNFL
ncbi:uncharacterized protein DFL_000752 [Arthrobotrys flagrans]|uniref:Uncharacterized protein n=1 Tax=Arthrobotrys flagrans TaxID=97331 RepID=A0A437AEL7_ARTFL|nr:hypothetical protein DFL_000752 [Arthrobotrys flagrans]